MRAFDRVRHLAIFNHVGLAGREHELAVRDIDLAAAEIDRVQAMFDRRDNFFRIAVAAEHIGIGHARHGQVGERFAPRVARSKAPR